MKGNNSGKFKCFQKFKSVKDILQNLIEKVSKKIKSLKKNILFKIKNKENVAKDDLFPVSEIELRGYRKYGKEYRCTLLSKPNRLKTKEINFS